MTPASGLRANPREGSLSLPSDFGQEHNPRAPHLTEEVEGCQGTGEHIPEALQPLALLLLAGAGEEEPALRGDDGEARFPAIPSDVLGQAFRRLVPLLLAPEKHLAQVKGVLEIEATGSSEVTPGAQGPLQP